jgi:hypothetical protein
VRDLRVVRSLGETEGEMLEPDELILFREKVLELLEVRARVKIRNVLGVNLRIRFADEAIIGHYCGLFSEPT